MTTTEISEIVAEYWINTKSPITSTIFKKKDLELHELLLLIPNNVKRRLGLPLTRIYGRRKHKIKRQKRHHALTWNLFNILEETILDLFVDFTMDAKFTESFVDIKNITVGDKSI